MHYLHEAEKGYLIFFLNEVVVIGSEYTTL